MKEPHKTTRWSVRVTAYVLIAALTLVAVECSSRVALHFKDELGPILNSEFSKVLEKSLDPYEVVSPRGYAHWTLKRGFKADARTVMQAKTQNSKILGAAAFATDISPPGTDDVGIIVNEDGFRGPEIRSNHDLLRILMLGDSVTFGLSNTTYPNAVRRRFVEKRIDAEIINGGVEGYSTRNIWIEMDRYLALRPDIVTIFVGWNDIFSEYQSSDAWYMQLATVRIISRLEPVLRNWISTPDQVVEKLYAKRENTISDDPKINGIAEIQLPYIDRLLEIANRFRNAGAKVYLMTLPGLFNSGETPTDKALKIGYLPSSIENPFVFAALTEHANQLLRDGASKEGIEILDTAELVSKHLVPRDDYYLDSVHFTPAGLRHFGEIIADQLCPKIPPSHADNVTCK